MPALADSVRAGNPVIPVFASHRDRSIGTTRKFDMTKQVRIENADTAPYRVLVQIWDKGADGAPDILSKEVTLGHPTAMTGGDVYLTSTRYLVVKELPALSTP